MKSEFKLKNEYESKTRNLSFYDHIKKKHTSFKRPNLFYEIISSKFHRHIIDSFDT